MKLGFIDYYLDEWHANNYPKWIAEATGGTVTVTDAYGLMDSEKDGGRTNAQWCFDMGIRQAMNMKALIERVDGIIVLSPDNAEMHEVLCQLPLRSGKPVYIDKTFAPDGEIAKRIFDIAQNMTRPAILLPPCVLPLSIIIWANLIVCPPAVLDSFIPMPFTRLSRP